MGRVDFNTILFSSAVDWVGTEIRAAQEVRCEAVQTRCAVTLDLNRTTSREKFGMCEDRDNSNSSSLGLYPASKGTDEGSVAGTENPNPNLVFPERRFS